MHKRAFPDVPEPDRNTSNARNEGGRAAGKPAGEEPSVEDPKQEVTENGGKITPEASNERTDAGRAGSALYGDAPSGSGSVSGEETSVAIPGEKRAIPARYEVRELADVRSSHLGAAFSPNPDYELKNERDYSAPDYNVARFIHSFIHSFMSHIFGNVS